MPARTGGPDGPWRRILVITDGVFSMDGDIAPLRDICDVADRYEAAVMVDDAHASGVLGRNGRGTVDHFDLHGRVDIQVGTLSKAVGVLGGYVAGRQHLRDYLIQRARPFLFSTSHPPAVAAACLAGIDVLETEPERIERLWANTRLFKSGLVALGFDTGISETPITPVIVGTAEVAQQMSRRLFEEGIFATSVVYPTVPLDKARIRTIVSSEHTTRAARDRPRRVRPSRTGTPPGRRVTRSRPTEPRWVCLDVGETLIDETRIWSTWADVLGIPRMTFLAAFGAVVARGEEHQDVFSLLGITGLAAPGCPRCSAATRASRPHDLYPDVLPAIAALRERGMPGLGHRQPASRADGRAAGAGRRPRA